MTQHGKKLVATTGEIKMTKRIKGKRIVRQYYTRLKVTKEQLKQLGYKRLDGDNNEHYLVAFKKDNRHKDNALHIVNHVFTEEN